MWWGIGIGGVILYFVVAFTLGLMSAQKRARMDVLLRDFLSVPLDFRRIHEADRDGTGLGPDRVGAAQVQRRSRYLTIAAKAG